MNAKGLMKRGIGALLASVFAFTSMPGNNVSAERAREDIPAEDIIPKQAEASMPKEDKAVYRLVRNGEASESGYQDMVWVDEDGKEAEGESSYEKKENAYRIRRAFPSAYSMKEEGELPAVKDQGQWGTCWAHAAICSIETNMIKKELERFSDVDYSERHLAYFAHRRDESLLDGADAWDDTYGWYGGGNHYSVTAALSNWYGAAAERDYPYVPYGEMEELTEDDRTSSVVHLTDVNLLGTQEDIKQAVLETGAVMCSFFSGDGTLGTAQENVYSSKKHAADHSVDIVGWDDAYSKTNFKDAGSMPENDGAWLCRNSWGDEWADEGYFHISYEDQTLSDFCSFEAERADNYQHIYSYNGAPALAAIGYNKSANLFTAGSVEELKAVSFHAFQNYDYEIQIYAQGETAMQTPSDGILVYSQKGSLAYPGYHTILLEQGVLLDAGMQYAVSVQFTAENKEDEKTFFEWGEEYSAGDGESFFYSAYEGWMDTKSCGENYGNVDIKAFTDTVERVNASRIAEVMAEAEKLSEKDYTPSSWKRLQEAVEQAESVYQSGGTQSDLIQAELGLKSAVNTLVPASVYISDEAEWEAFAESAASLENYAEQTVYLQNDLDMTGITHRAVGTGGNPFMGTFDGGGHSISNLEYAYPYSFAGLFGYIGETGVVKDVHVKASDFTFTAAYSGGIVGGNQGTVTGCSVEGNIRIDAGHGFMGGIAGYNEGVIEQSYVDGTVRFQDQQDEGDFLGGITAYNTGSILRCFVRGKLVSDSPASIGGIVGYSDKDSSVKECFNLADISGNPEESTRTAGIGVCMYGSTDSCYNYGKILRQTDGETGAVYCYQSGSFSNCYYREDGSIKGGYSPAYVKGRLSEDDFASAKAAYYLNSSGGAGVNTYVWSQKDGLPVWADSENKAVIKAEVSQKNGNSFPVSINGVTSGVFYAKGSSEAEVRVLTDQQAAGAEVTVELPGLIFLEEENRYLLPDIDVEVTAVCQRIGADPPDITSETPGISETPGTSELPDLPDDKGGTEFKKGAVEVTGIGAYRVVDAVKKTAALVQVKNKKAKTLKVPPTVKICGVTCNVVEIGEKACKGCSRLKKVTLGKNITKIGSQAFMNCKKLKTVVLQGKGLKKVQKSAFKKTAAGITVQAKKMTKKQKAALLVKLKKAGCGKKAKVK